MPPNRLANEQSPYLLQHADNPVDWYPWGEEAFSAARDLDRPIFLSIGYATCHWCHVMEHESFEDEDVARLMNESFVNVKVDREERPDIDGIYMAVAQMATGHGGWPLTIVMTPDRLPFFSGTYFPRESRFGRPGMLDLVPRIRELWQTRRDDLLTAAHETRDRLQSLAEADRSGRALDADTLSRGFQELELEYDQERGGFGRAPRFPTPHRLLFLLRFWRRTGVDQALEMVVKTLDALRAGGIFDQVGCGFHRYSTDDQWLLPHFEKMLYDQALLVMAYVEAFQATGDASHARVAKQVLEYVLRDMTAPDGGFYSAEDADSEGEEGKFYLWTDEELRQVLGESDADFAALVLEIRPGGNFVDEATGERSGTSIPHLAEPLEARAAELGLELSELEHRLDSVRERLLEHRSRRIRPLLDDKILADWNGLMIAALAKAGGALDAPEYVESATRAAAFLWTTMQTDGRLLHRYRDGDADIEANLDDYAFVAWAEIELHQVTQDPEHLRRAIVLTDSMLERFHDDASGGLFFSPAGRPDLIVRQREVYDGAVPSGNSVALSNLLRLARLTAEAKYERAAGEVSRAFSRTVGSHPSAFSMFLCGLELVVDGGQELVIAGDPESDAVTEMLDVAGRGYEPHLVTILRPAGEDARGVTEIAPFLVEFRGEPGAEATAYLCRGLMCERPVTSVAELKSLLEQVRRDG
ncbi:MAG: thioredoxin domain-containing protein [Gemmatimonadetes bacterium]|nr:thioredoxin domain-containing protein [Gemmatimonadota bacterium]